MKPIHFILALSLLLYIPARARDIEPLLRKLDAAIANQSTYILEKESRIDSLRSALILADTPREKWEAEMALHAQMSSYNLDSALAHIKKAETIARALNDTSLVFRRIDKPRLSIQYLGGDAQRGLRYFQSLAAPPAGLGHAVRLLLPRSASLPQSCNPLHRQRP